jgi:hypothetical protein
MDTEIFKLSKKANKKHLVDFLDEKTEDEVTLINKKLCHICSLFEQTRLLILSIQN